VAAVNKYIVENEPWAVAEKEDETGRARLATILYTAAEALRIVTALAHPVLPDSTARIWKQLGLGDIARLSLRDLEWGQLKLGTKLGTIEPVFPRADKSSIDAMQQMEQRRPAAGAPAAGDQRPQSAEKPPVAGSGARAGEPAAQPATGPSPPAPPPVGASAAAGGDGKITLEDFARVEMRVGQIKVAEPVKGADKLLRLEVDIGTEVRQVVAGIAQAYTPDSLIGRKVIIVTNLAPRKLRGVESNGMIVAATVGEKGSPVLAGFLEDVPVGARLK